MRNKIVAGNWKMNKDLFEGLKLASEVVNMTRDEVSSETRIILCPPYIHLNSINKLCDEVVNVHLAAQNCSDQESGAYTGEVSAEMVKSCGAGYVILGHSERREYFNESDELLAAKIDVALKNDLKVIFCCGEPLEIRNEGTQESYVKQQITNSLFHLSGDAFENITIAYEPIWAIGTGMTATAEQAQEMHHSIRGHLTDQYGSETSENISILYGGSVKPGNAREIFSQPDVDGGLIGGASLEARDFISIAQSI